MTAATIATAAGAANPAPGFLQSVYAATAARSDAEREARAACALLTDSQRSTLVLLAQGLSRKEVGEHVGRAPVTVDNWVRDGLATLGVDTVIEAAVLLTRAGLV